MAVNEYGVDWDLEDDERPLQIAADPTTQALIDTFGADADLVVMSRKLYDRLFPYVQDLAKRGFSLEGEMILPITLTAGE